MHNRTSIITLSSTASPGVFPTSPAGGTGVWATVQVADDGDRRSAENLQALALGNAQNLDFIAWRTVDWVGGGNYISWTSSLNFGNIFHFYGDVHIETPATFYLLSTSTAHQVANGAVLNIGSPGILGTGELVVTANGFVFFDSGSACTWLGGAVAVGGTTTWTYDINTVVMFNCRPTFAGGGLFNEAIVRTGAGAFERGRINLGPDATQNITPTDLDTWVIPVLGADRTWTLDNPVVAGTDKSHFRVRQPPGSFTQLHNLTIKDSAGITLAVFAPGAVSTRSASVDFEDDSLSGGSWAVVNKYDPDGHVSVA